MYSFSFFLKVNGVNLLKVHALAYRHMLLDTLFTRAELMRSLLFSFKKVKSQLGIQKSGTATK